MQGQERDTATRWTMADAMLFLKTFTDYEQKAAQRLRSDVLDLSRMRAFSARMGSPERTFDVIHVTGSKGKGSTTFMIDAILRAAGRRVGRFISPHLMRLNERIAVLGEDLGDDAFAEAIRAFVPFVEEMRRTHAAHIPTFFECMTMAAFTSFRAAGCDAAVIEVGLGGRLDATNIVEPAVSVITMLDLEHTRILGSTLEKIAFEKAGIIKAGRPAVVGVPADSPEGRTIAAVAAERRSPVLWFGDRIHARITESIPGRFRFDVTVEERSVSGLELHAFGPHQVQNAALAVAAALTWAKSREMHLTDEAIRDGLLNVRLPARLELFPAHRAPLVLPYPVLLDSSHTPKSTRALAAALPAVFPGLRPTLVFGILRDKNIDACIEPLLPLVDRCLLTDVRSPRAVPAFELLRRIRRLAPGTDAAVLPHLADHPGDLKDIGARALVIAGSAYLAGELRKALVGMNP